MSFNNAYNRFKLISGLSDEEIVPWVPIIKEAIAYVKTLINKKEPTDYDKLRLSNASGVYAYYRYISYSLNTESSFSAGDVSVTTNKDKIQEAEKMWKTELDSICDLTVSNFTFKMVK